VVAGVAVRPGDYVFADACGAAVIPAGEVRAVLRAANQVLVEDAPAIATIRGEAPTTLGGNENRRGRESAPQIRLFVGLSPG
jgi:4-hydroxy-4-methyl-2-oxoglutarate aldolase